MNKKDIEALNEAYQDINDLVATHYKPLPEPQKLNTNKIYPTEITKLLENLLKEVSNGAYLEMGPDEINNILKRAVHGAYDISKRK